MSMICILASWLHCLENVCIILSLYMPTLCMQFYLVSCMFSQSHCYMNIDINPLLPWYEHSIFIHPCEFHCPVHYQIKEMLWSILFIGFENNHIRPFFFSFFSFFPPPLWSPKLKICLSWLPLPHFIPSPTISS